VTKVRTKTEMNWKRFAVWTFQLWWHEWRAFKNTSQWQNRTWILIKS